MYALLAFLTLAAVTLAPTSEEVYPFDFSARDEAIGWHAWIQTGERCSTRAWLSQPGQGPLMDLFAVELEEGVTPTRDGEAPLRGLQPGRYDLHIVHVGDCWAVVNVITR